MRATIGGWVRRAGHVTWLAGFVVVGMATNDDGSCGSLPDGGEVECNDRSDCEGMPHIMCEGSWACDEGVCRWDCSAPGCDDNGDCPDGQLCRDDGTCVDAPPDLGCYSSDTCPRGQHCNVEDGVCGAPPGCGPGQACPAVCYGQCVDDVDPCLAMLCGPGTICEDGQCVPVGQTCARPEDCPTGTYCGCVTGAEADSAGGIACELQCLPIQGACNADGDCKEGQACVNGLCVDKPAECWSDLDCGGGWYCDFSMCWGTDPAFAPPDDGDAERPAPQCPGMCVPQGEVCEDGQVCARGHHCEERCTGVCPPCERPDEDGACDALCEVECKSECVPDSYGECLSDADCKDGYYCGGCGDMPPMPNGIAVCYRQCLPKDPPICHNDWECGPNQRCDLIACQGAVPECDPSSGQACDQDRPAPPEDCWGYCVDERPECRSDADCGEGSYCQIEWCTSSPEDPNFWPGTCGGHCAPIDPPVGECATDRDCVNAAGVQGWCQRYCEAEPVDTDGDGHPDCDPNDASCAGALPPEPTCKGVCHYPDPITCDPSADTCPDGTHCAPGCDGNYMPAGLIYCPWMCVPDATKCSSNCECGYGEQCLDGTCQKVETFGCDDNWSCPEGFICGCAYGADFGMPCYPQCVPERPQCCSDSDCGDGNQCVDGACQPWYCWDGACPEGYACESQCNFPTPANGLIACPQVCVPEAPACASDCDCPSYEACINGACQVADRLNECYPLGCKDDSMCAPGEQCLMACPACIPGEECGDCFGWCVARPECKSDEDCGEGQYCHKEASCPDCTNADPACMMPCTISDVGYCADDPTPPGECKLDSDCAEGEQCMMYCPPCACPVNPDGSWGPCPWCECKGACEPSEPPPPPPPTDGCFVGGCSGQICSADPDAASDCMWRDYYKCFQLTTCGAQADGSCGWAETPEFKQCMLEHGGYTDTP